MSNGKTILVKILDPYEDNEAHRNFDYSDLDIIEVYDRLNRDGLDLEGRVHYKDFSAELLVLDFYLNEDQFNQISDLYEWSDYIGVYYIKGVRF